VFVILVVASFLIIGVPVAWFDIPLGAVLTLGFAWWGSGVYFPQSGERRRIFANTVVISAVAITSFTLISGWIYDLSWDGQGFHIDAVLQLDKGWDPVYSPPSVTDADFADRVTLYTKAHWYYAAANDKLTGVIEQGKAIHLSLILAVVCIGWSTFTRFRQIGRGTRIVLCVLLALNPISLAQTFSLYNDGVLASSLIALICLLLAWYRKADRLLLAGIIGVIALTLNAKLTGALEVLILCGGFLAWLLWTRREGRIGLIIAVVSGGIFGGVWMGWNPFVTQYVTNLVLHHDPFYPTGLEDAIAGPIDRSVFSNMDSMSPIERLLWSLFAQSKLINNVADSNIKVPFTFDMDEVVQFAYPDVRVGGFGPLFSGALILTGVVCVLIARKLLSNMAIRKRLVWRHYTILVIIGLLTISVLINPTAWWSRYAPQIFVIILFCLVSGLILSYRRPEPRANPSALRNLSVTATFVLVINALLITAAHGIGSVVANAQMIAQFADLKASGQPIVVYMDQQVSRVISTQMRLDDWGIPYRLVDRADELPCPETMQFEFISSRAVGCIPSPISDSGRLAVR
jgi:hypothetical protein